MHLSALFLAQASQCDFASSSSSVNRREKWFSEKVESFLLEHPNAYDVTFCVGPAKEKVRAVRFLLVVSSPVFKKLFLEQWDQALGKKNEGIPIADVDPGAFRIFLKLLPCEHITLDVLKTLNLPNNQILNLVYISKKYGMITMTETFEEMSKVFLREFNTYAQTPDFLNLSEKTLATALASDAIDSTELEIFNHACRWAENKCLQSGYATEPKEIRMMLGDCLKEIRFPLMNSHDFGRTVYEKKVLTPEELSEVFRFIALDEGARATFNAGELGFKTTPRNIFVSKLSTLSSMPRTKISIFGDSELVSDPSFDCDGRRSILDFDTDRSIEVLGVGFLGPADSDGDYVVQLSTSTCINGEWVRRWEVTQTIHAKRCQMFYFMFPDPFICYEKSKTSRCYNSSIGYSLTGPKMQMVDKFKESEKMNGHKMRKNDVHFDFRFINFQIGELLYRQL